MSAAREAVFNFSVAVVCGWAAFTTDEVWRAAIAGMFAGANAVLAAQGLIAWLRQRYGDEPRGGVEPEQGWPRR